MNPAFRADAVVTAFDRRVVIELDGHVYEFATLCAPKWKRALELMNGHLTIDQIAHRVTLPVADVSTIVAKLGDVEALHYVNLTAGGDIESDRFVTRCRELYAHWKVRLFSHPLWVGLTEGAMPRSVFIGWSIESYWFILGVLDRLPLAIASATTADVRGVFARHFAEEWDHFRYFERTLDTLDITQEQRNQAEPLPTTRAIQNWMRAAARRDVVHYAVCSGFLESTGRDRDVARTFFDRLASHYCDRGRQSVAPMAEHVSLDEAYGHGGFVEKVLGSQNKIDINRARSALNAAFGLVETLEMWSTDIVRHYSQSNSLPLTPTRAYRQLHT